MIRDNRDRLRALGVLLFSLAPLCLAGCAGKNARPLAPARLQAIAHTERGIELEAGGQNEPALAEFGEALRLQSAIENDEGMVIALINIARTRRLKGDLAAARQAAERAALLLPQSSELESELYFERAKILLAAGDLASAQSWALRAESAEKGGALGRRANLVAAIVFRRGLPEQAREQAERALTLSRADRLVGEEANALRLLGEIHLVQGTSARAIDCFSEALSLDKEQSLGRKIALDLRGLGRALRKKGDLPRAIGFYRRALEVSLNRGDAGSASGDLDVLTELYRLNGEPVLAEQLAAERKKLPAP